MKQDSGSRIIYLDLVRAVAIICMVWLHCGTFFRVTDIFVHMFHMPVFFMLSGYLINADKDFVIFLKRKSQTLLIPYFFWGSLLYVLWSFIYWLINSKEDIVPFTKFIYSIFYDNAMTSPYACVQWFFTALFFANALFYCVLRMSKGVRTRIIMLTVILFGIGSLMYFLPFRLPLSIDVSFMAAAFIGTGYLIKDLKPKAYLYPILMLVIAALFFINICHWNMRTLDYGMPVLYFIGSSSFSYLVICICKLICDKVPQKALEPFLFIGRNSIWFLIINQFYIRLFNIIFKRLELNVPGCMTAVITIILIIPTILLGNKYLGWTIGKFNQARSNQKHKNQSRGACSNHQSG